MNRHGFPDVVFLRSLLVSLALGGLLGTGARAASQGEDPFALENKFGVRVAQEPAAADPFAKENQAGPRTAPKGPKTLPSKGEAVADLIDFQVTVTPKEARPGQVVKLTITGTPKPGYHTYAFTKRTPNQKGQYLVSALEFKNVPGIKPLWPVKETEPELVKEGDEYFLEHSQKFDLVQDILVLPDAAEGSVRLPFSIVLQVCKNKCSQGTIALEGLITVKGQAVALTVELEKRRQEKAPEATLVPIPGGAPVAGPGGLPLNAGFLAFILSGIFWGAVSLVTPCVFPMIPITVSFFLKQSEKEHHRPITMALVYCGTIVVVLTIAALALLSFFRALSTNPTMNFLIGGLFIFFALSLFGMYDIELPSGLARFTSAREGKGGLLGTMFMALTFTIISFACVAPFLGGFGGTAANSNLTLLHRILGGLAFAVTFASPFFILALFPTLLKKLPKSGSWLNTVKVVMGFLELAAAFKFLRAGELVILPQPAIFTYDFVLGLYIALSLLSGLYLLGLYRLPHDSPMENLGVPRLLLSLAFIGLAFYLSPALFKQGERGHNQRPSGAIFAWLDSFLLPEEQESELPWIANLDQGLAEARTRRQLVFVDFTGVTCTNCKINERNVFVRPTVKNLLQQYQLVQLYTDVVPDRFYPPEERVKLGNNTTRQRADAQKNLEFQREKFDTEQLPLYVILQPLAKGGFREVSRYDEGRIIDDGAFLRFLQQPLAETRQGLASRQPASG